MKRGYINLRRVSVPFSPHITPFPNTILRPSQIQKSCRRQLKCGYQRILRYRLHRKLKKAEIARFEQFHRLLQCFPKAFLFNVLKRVYMGERVNLPFVRDDQFDSCDQTIHLHKTVSELKVRPVKCTSDEHGIKF